MGSDVLVVAERLKGELAEVTFELLGKGRELATQLSGKLSVALVGGGTGPVIEALGAADEVLVIDHQDLVDFNPEAHVTALSEVIDKVSPAITLIANTSMGMDLAAALATRRSLPIAAYCVDLSLDGGELVATSQLYGGKIYAETVLEGESVVVSVLAGSFAADAGRTQGAPAIKAMDPGATPDTARLRFTGLSEPEAGDVDITQHEILVAVGRGIQSEDNLPMVEELAAALGGAVCASRPIVDSKWLPKNRQVGKSGLKVKPRIYLALGISGAPEHVEGMKDAELIIAVNSDENAPIFEHAHYGTTEDLFDIVPALVARLK